MMERLVNNELEIMPKKEVVEEFDALPQNLPEGTEKIMNKMP